MKQTPRHLRKQTSWCPYDSVEVRPQLDAAVSRYEMDVALSPARAVEGDRSLETIPQSESVVTRKPSTLTKHAKLPRARHCSNTVSRVTSTLQKPADAQAWRAAPAPFETLYVPSAESSKPVGVGWQGRLVVAGHRERSPSVDFCAATASGPTLAGAKHAAVTTQTESVSAKTFESSVNRWPGLPDEPCLEFEKDADTNYWPELPIDISQREAQSAETFPSPSDQAREIQRLRHLDLEQRGVPWNA